MTAGSTAGSGQPSIRTAGMPHLVALPAPPVIRVLPGAPESATTARRLTRQLLGDRHPAADTAMLLVSELVTNSVMHSRSRRPGGTITVAVCAGTNSVLIQVRDDGGPAEPRVQSAQASSDGAALGHGAASYRAGAGDGTAPGDGTSAGDGAVGDRPLGNRAAAGDVAAAAGEHGYGLLLVDALAETWGTVATADGRVTWCRLAVDRH